MFRWLIRFLRGTPPRREGVRAYYDSPGFSKLCPAEVRIEFHFKPGVDPRGYDEHIYSMVENLRYDWIKFYMTCINDPLTGVGDRRQGIAVTIYCPGTFVQYLTNYSEWKESFEDDFRNKLGLEALTAEIRPSFGGSGSREYSSLIQAVSDTFGIEPTVRSG